MQCDRRLPESSFITSPIRTVHRTVGVSLVSVSSSIIEYSASLPSTIWPSHCKAIEWDFGDWLPSGGERKGDLFSYSISLIASWSLFLNEEASLSFRFFWVPSYRFISFAVALLFFCTVLLFSCVFVAIFLGNISANNDSALWHLNNSLLSCIYLLSSSSFFLSFFLLSVFLSFLLLSIKLLFS